MNFPRKQKLVKRFETYMSRLSFRCWFRICKKINRLLWQFPETQGGFPKILWKTGLRIFSQKWFCLWKYALGPWLSGADNRRSISCSYQKLFKKQPSALTSGTNSSSKKFKIKVNPFFLEGNVGQHFLNPESFYWNCCGFIENRESFFIYWNCSIA